MLVSFYPATVQRKSGELHVLFSPLHSIALLNQILSHQYKELFPKESICKASTGLTPLSLNSVLKLPLSSMIALKGGSNSRRTEHTSHANCPTKAENH